MMGFKSMFPESQSGTFVTTGQAEREHNSKVGNSSKCHCALGYRRSTLHHEIIL